MSETKFCKDCKNIVPIEENLCAASRYAAATDLDLVTGEPSQPFRMFWPCRDARGDEGLCGRSGKRFEARA